eukprot:9857022-Heterocapsa_arctica.AAC.1
MVGFRPVRRQNVRVIAYVGPVDFHIFHPPWRALIKAKSEQGGGGQNQSQAAQAQGLAQPLGLAQPPHMTWCVFPCERPNAGCTGNTHNF